MVLEIFLGKLFSYAITPIKEKYCSFLFQKYSQLELASCLQQLAPSSLLKQSSVHQYAIFLGICNTCANSLKQKEAKMMKVFQTFSLMLRKTENWKNAALPNEWDKVDAHEYNEMHR